MSSPGCAGTVTRLSSCAPTSSHGSPLTALAAALLPLLEPGLSEVDSLEKTQKLAAVLRGDGRSGLHSTVTTVLNWTGARSLLLVVDQCEEALAAPDQEVAELADLLAVGSLPDAVRVLITLRADFLDPALATPSLGPLAGHRIRPLFLRPDNWAEALCRVLGGSDLTAEERGSQPVPVPSEPVGP
ncbi:hypothetical protein E4N62_01635 [Streptomyces sp. MNU76]|uniref:nSTAND1 domain-containing NTPase n=1 Tax=Streptomyces sp. MNU76 TaxID=2560026 RepID=UPI001E624220|nr:hypothetical protein [Streptomyces sp. MNU76]MCC9704077.1 hypothetical protein [Streptomyces sp. MNU76]